MVIGIRRWHIQCDDEKIKPGSMRVLDSSVHVQECHLRDASGAVDPTQQCLKPLNDTLCERQTKDPDCNDTALLLVCRQFNEDAAKLKWQNHVLILSTRYTLPPDLSEINKSGRMIPSWPLASENANAVQIYTEQTQWHELWFDPIPQFFSRPLVDVAPDRVHDEGLQTGHLVHSV